MPAELARRSPDRVRGERNAPAPVVALRRLHEPLGGALLEVLERLPGADVLARERPHEGEVCLDQEILVAESRFRREPMLHSNCDLTPVSAKFKSNHVSMDRNKSTWLFLQ
jgi:hypothetical protein